MIELTKQMGDLSKCIMLQENYYSYQGKKPENLKENIGNELADILGQLIRIAAVSYTHLAAVRTEKG